MKSTGKNIQYEIKGIKCDNCDWKDETIKLEDYSKYLNKECPKCGENLLTQEDYDMVKFIANLADSINQIDLPESSNSEMLDMTIDVHNKKIEIKDENKTL